MLLGLWSGGPHYLDDRLETPNTVDDVTTSLNEAVEYIVERLSPGTAPSARRSPRETANAARAS
jgi:hypothetical protein